MHVGVGAAGWVDAQRSVVYYAPNLAWRDEHLGEELSESCGIPVVVENDGNAAAWGEYRFGAGIGFEDVVCVTVGTGIGGGMVLGGSIYRGGFGIAAEFGHVRVGAGRSDLPVRQPRLLGAVCERPSTGPYGAGARHGGPQSRRDTALAR